MEGDFLKKLKQSLESGKTDESVNQIHYDILNKAGETSKQKQQKRIEAARAKRAEQVEGMDYLTEVDAFLRGMEEQKSLTGDVSGISNPMQDRISHLGEVKEFLEDSTIPLTSDEVKHHNEKTLAEYNQSREKHEKIEMNEANIKLLEDEIKVFELKILKNKDLIAFLKLENSKI